MIRDKVAAGWSNLGPLRGNLPTIRGRGPAIRDKVGAR
jgi:hypothetical protein